MLIKAKIHTICTEDLNGTYLEIPADNYVEVDEVSGQDLLIRFGEVLDVKPETVETPVESTEVAPEVTPEVAPEIAPVETTSDELPAMEDAIG